MILMPLDEDFTESSSDVQSFILPRIPSKSSYPSEYDYEDNHSTWRFPDELISDRTCPWIRRYKSIHQSQRLTGILHDQWHNHRKTQSRN